jgi:hypothetical protein
MSAQTKTALIVLTSFALQLYGATSRDDAAPFVSLISWCLAVYGGMRIMSLPTPKSQQGDYWDQR